MKLSWVLIRISRFSTGSHLVKFFKMLFSRQPQRPQRVVTDKLRSYKAALRKLNSDTPHTTTQYENNIAEHSY